MHTSILIKTLDGRPKMYFLFVDEVVCCVWQNFVYSYTVLHTVNFMT